MRWPKIFRIMGRWLERPYLFVFPAIGAVAAIVLALSVRYHWDGLPFTMVAIIFLSAFGTLAISFWPYMIPFVITIDEAAAPHSSLAFMFWGEGPVRLPADAALHRHQLQRLSRQGHQPHGFDCPGCAWPDPKHTSSFEFCENGVKAVTWEATAKRTTPEFFAAHTVSELWNWPDFDLENEGRLTHPMAYDRATDRYLPISWDEALAKIGAALRELPHPDMAEFYTSGRASNEAAFLYQLFAREYGTNNFPDCSNMCHEATSVGLPGINWRRQGNRDPGGLRSLRRGLLHRPQSRDQSSAHVDDAP